MLVIYGFALRGLSTWGLDRRIREFLYIYSSFVHTQTYAVTYINQNENQKAQWGGPRGFVFGSLTELWQQIQRS